MLNTMYDFGLAIIENISRLYDYIFKPILMGYSIIDLLGAGVIVLVGVWLVKSIL